MNQNTSIQNEPSRQGSEEDCHNDPHLQELIKDAAKALDIVLQELPHMRYQIVDRAEERIVSLRDCLIERLRAAQDPDERQQLQEMLDPVNAALSMVVGVEYPGAGIQQKPLEMARETLRRMEI